MTSHRRRWTTLTDKLRYCKGCNNEIHPDMDRCIVCGTPNPNFLGRERAGGVTGAPARPESPRRPPPPPGSGRRRGR